MPFQLFQNNAKGTLSVAVTTNSQASITLQTGQGAKFPTPSAPSYYSVTLDDGTNIEVLLVVARASDVLTVLRGQEGTTAQSSFAIGTKCELRLTNLGMQWCREQQMQMQFWARAVTNVTSWHVNGTTLPTILGTQAAAAMMNSSWREQNTRQRISSSNSAQSPVDFHIAQACVDGANGFRSYWRFGVPLMPNSSHFFIGWINTTGQVASVHPPTSMQNMVGVGWSNAGSYTGTNLKLYWNAAGVATYFDLGSYFSINTVGWYEFGLWAEPGASVFNWSLSRLDISSIAQVSSSISASIPGNSLWLSPLMHGVTMATSQLAVELGGITWST